MQSCLVFCVLAVTVVGVKSHAVVVDDVKRNAVQDPLRSMFVQQELLLKSIEKIVVEKFAELKGELKSQSDKITASDKSNVDKFAELKGELKSLSDIISASDKSAVHSFAELIADHKTLTDRITVSGAKCETLQNDTNALLENFPCPSGYGKNNFGCYKISSEAASWDNASSICRSEGTHLLSIETSFELQALDQWMKDNGATSGWFYWTGAKLVNGQWTWATVNKHMAFTNWQTGEPSGTDSCGELFYGPSATKHLKWYDDYCHNSKHFICESWDGAELIADHKTLTDRITVSGAKCETLQNYSNALLENFLQSCPSGYGKNNFGCYKISSEAASWDNASSICRSEGTHLLSIETSFELQALGQWMKDNGVTSGWAYWIGGKLVNGQWTWVTINKPMTYTNWQIGNYYFVTTWYNAGYPTRLWRITTSLF